MSAILLRGAENSPIFIKIFDYFCDFALQNGKKLYRIENGMVGQSRFSYILPKCGTELCRLPNEEKAAAVCGESIRDLP